MISIRLLIPDQQRRRWLTQLIPDHPEIRVVTTNVTLESDAEMVMPAFDVVVVDLAHPGVTQARFWATLHVLYPNARYVALTEAPLEPTLVGAALQAGATYMVDWSESPVRIQRAIRAAADGVSFIPRGRVLQAMCDFFGSPGLLPRTIAIGDVCLDLEQHRLLRGQQAIPLAPLEFDVLHCLAARAGQIFTSNELARDAWRERHSMVDPDSRIRSIVKRIRKKIELDPQHPKIPLNVFGHGYYVPEQPP